MSKIAFLGLGMMGDPMARRLVEAGNHVTVWDRSPSHTEPFAHIAAIAGSPHDAVVGAEFVVTMLATPQALESVLFGSHGVSSSITSGQTWIDMSTVGPAEFATAASRLPAGVSPVDAPVRGSVPEATEGRLHIFVGSDDDLFDRIESLLNSLGDIRHAGGPGSGAAMKISGQSGAGRGHGHLRRVSSAGRRFRPRPGHRHGRLVGVSHRRDRPGQEGERGGRAVPGDLQT